MYSPTDLDIKQPHIPEEFNKHKYGCRPVKYPCVNCDDEDYSDDSSGEEDCGKWLQLYRLEQKA